MAFRVGAVGRGDFFLAFLGIEKLAFQRRGTCATVPALSAIRYFGYGSNMDMQSLRAKGVVPRVSTPGALPGWRLRFNVHHWFQHEGGVGNICPTTEPGARVLGVVHECEEDALVRLDAVESVGVGYQRVELPIQTPAGTVAAVAYVGLPSYLDDRCLPTRRYLNLLVRGAEHAGIDASYIAWLRAHPVHQPQPAGPFVVPAGQHAGFTLASLAEHPTHTGLDGAVFDMAGCRWQHECLLGLLGGRDTTLFHLRRMDDSDGTESLDDVKRARLTTGQRAYLDAYLHGYAAEYRYAGTLTYP